jgi:hypothetical protein
MGRIQPTSLAYATVVLPDNSAATLERCDICHSIKPKGIPLVRESDSPRILPPSPALAGLGGVSWGKIRPVGIFHCFEDC